MKEQELTRQMSINLSKIMKNRQITNKVLADIIGVDTSRVSKLVRGKCIMTSKQIFDLARELNISTDVIYGITTEKEQLYKLFLCEMRFAVNEYNLELTHNCMKNIKRMIELAKKRQ